MKLKKSAVVIPLFLITLTFALFIGCHSESPSSTPESTPVKPPEVSAEGDFSKGILNRNEVIKSAAEVTREKYPNADDVLVDDYIFSAYKPDGTSVTWDDTFTKILTEKAKRDHQTLSFYFTRPYSTINVKILEIIRKDGKVESIDIDANSKIMVNPSQMGQNIYNPNSKILKVNIPGLEIGDMLRYVTFRNEEKTRVSNTWSDYQILEYTSPIKHMVIEIMAPESLPLSRTSVKDNIKGTVTTEINKVNNSIRYRWIVKDVPRMFTEPNMPPLSSVVQRLLVSTIKEWKDVSKWYWKLAKPHLEKVTPEMKKKVIELTSKARTDKKKIEAIFRFVSQKIRYMGITTEKEAPGYEPHDVDITFNNQYGVCRDKAALLVSMLRIAGFKAYPVLIMNGPKKDPDVPNPYFNHAITCVEDKNGKYILMDSTDETTRDLFPAYLCNQSYLVAKPEGDILRTSRIIPAEDNLMQIRTHASVNDTGIMIAETSMRFSGINDGAYRGYFARRKPIERKRFFEKVIKKVFPGAKLVEYDIQPKNIQDTSQPLKVYIRYIGENTFIKGDGKVMLPPPWIGSSVGMVNFILGKTGLEKRKYPLMTEIACGVEENFYIDLKNALGAKIALPESKPINKETITWYQNFNLKNKILSGQSKFLLEKVEYSPEQYTSLKDSLKKIEFNKRKTPIFYGVGTAKVADNMVSENANIAVLNETVEYKVKDNSTWEVARTARKKILTYAGKKNFSELKFLYNPEWENITVEYAKVKQKNGNIKKINKDEINLMDAGWVGSAPRYPPSKILVINLPGVEKGSEIEYRVVRKYKNRPFFSMIEYFQGFNPIVKKSVRLEVPEKMNLKISNRNRAGNNVFVYKNGKKGDYAWKGIAADALKWERDLPPAWAFIPSCAVSSGNWKDYAKIISSTLEKAAEKQSKTKQNALKLIKGIKDPLKKIEMIRNYVATNIKKAGPGLGELPLSAVSPADVTLTDGYGNSTDRAVLLYSMLKTAGFYPDFVLVSNYPRIDQLKRLDQIPQSSVFNKVLVHIIYKNQNIYLNDTDQYAQLGTSSSENLTALFCASGKIDKIQLNPKMSDRTDYSYSIRLSEKGTALITSKRTFYGTDYAYWNKKYQEMSHEEKNRHHQELVADVSQSAIPTGKLKTTFTKYPGSEEFAVSVNNFAVLEKKYLYIKLPGSLKSVLGIHADLRENPYIFDAARRSTRSYLLNLPPEYARKIPISPNSENWKLPSDAGTISIVNDRDIFGATAKPVLFINQDIDIKPALIPKDEFDVIQMISSKISNQKTQTLLMEKVQEKNK